MIKKIEEYYIFLLSITIVIFIWYGSYYYLETSCKSPAERGQFGDQFGAVNSLFSGLAFAGLAFSIYLQKQELNEVKAQAKTSEENITIKEFLRELNSKEQKSKRRLLYNSWKEFNDWVKNNNIENINGFNKEELFLNLKKNLGDKNDLIRDYFKGKLTYSLNIYPFDSGTINIYRIENGHSAIDTNITAIGVFHEICTFFNYWGHIHSIKLLPTRIFSDDSGKKTIEYYNQLSIFIKEERKTNPGYCEHFESLVKAIYEENKGKIGYEKPNAL